MNPPSDQITHLSTEELDAGLDHILASPRDVGTLELIVARPTEDARDVLAEGRLDVDTGLVGDNWIDRPSSRTDDGSAHPEMQLNIINARVSALIAQDPDRRQLAGDQLHVDLDLSESNLPPGTRLALGDAIVEVTAEPHMGCAKFTRRFGRDAHRWVNSARGRELKLRGINAKVVQPGAIRAGDEVRKL